MTVIDLDESDLESAQVAQRTYLSRRRSPRVDAAVVLSLMIALLTLIPSRYILPGMTDLGRPALVVCLLLFAWWVVVRLTPHLVLPGPQPIRWALLGFALSYIISYAAGQLRGLTSMEANGADRAMLFLAIFCGAALAAADGIPNWHRLNSVLRVLVACGVFVAAVALIQFAFAYDLTTYLTIPGLQQNKDVLGFEQRGAGIRVASTTTHYIELATSLATILPFAIHSAIFAKTRRSRQYYIAAALVIAGATLTTISRSGVLALGIVVLVLLPMWTWRLRYNILAIAMILLAGLSVAKPSLVTTLFKLFNDPSSNPAFTVRQARYPLVWYYVSQRPWLGRGTGTYLAPMYQILDNEWLAFLISNGIIGVVAMAAMHITGMAAAFIAMRRTANPEVRHLAAVLISTQLIALVVAGTYDSMAFLTYAILVALTLGLCGTIWRLSHPARAVRTAAPHWFAAEDTTSYMHYYIRR